LTIWKLYFTHLIPFNGPNLLDFQKLGFALCKKAAMQIWIFFSSDLIIMKKRFFLHKLKLKLFPLFCPPEPLESWLWKTWFCTTFKRFHVNLGCSATIVLQKILRVLLHKCMLCLSIKRLSRYWAVNILLCPVWSLTYYLKINRSNSHWLSGIYQCIKSPVKILLAGHLQPIVWW
jgi:hypothetical protein